MPQALFVVMAHGDRAPVLLGPMSPDMRTRVMQDLHARYGPECSLHAMDLESDGPGRVTARINPYEPQKGAS